MLVPLVGLLRRPPLLCPFLAACSVTGPAAVEALAQVLSLVLVGPPVPEPDLGSLAPLRHGLLGLRRMRCGYCAWAFPSGRRSPVLLRGLFSFLPSWVCLGQHAVGANVGIGISRQS
jgi:hypothetical protein